MRRRVVKVLQFMVRLPTIKTMVQKKGGVVASIYPCIGKQM